MSEDERRERIHALAEIIDDFLAEDSAFVLVVFPREEPETCATIAFDVVSNHHERSYTALVLQHVVDGIEQHEGLTLGDPEGKPN